jgi:hypothetical protein
MQASLVQLDGFGASETAQRSVRHHGFFTEPLPRVREDFLASHLPTCASLGRFAKAPAPSPEPPPQQLQCSPESSWFILEHHVLLYLLLWHGYVAHRTYHLSLGHE